MGTLGIAPKLFGRLKYHKPAFPLRSIVPCCFSPTYYIEKAFVLFLRKILPHFDFVINSTHEFIDKIIHVYMNWEAIIESFAIVSLFPSIDVQEVTQNIGAVIDSLTSLDDKVKISLTAGLNLIILSNIMYLMASITSNLWVSLWVHQYQIF